MSTSNSRRRDPERFSAETAFKFAGITLVAALIVVTNIAARGGNSLAGNSITVSRNPVVATIEILTGKAPWPQQATYIAAALTAALVMLAVTVVALLMKGGTRRT